MVRRLTAVSKWSLSTLRRAEGHLNDLIVLFTIKRMIVKQCVCACYLTVYIVSRFNHSLFVSLDYLRLNCMGNCVTCFGLTSMWLYKSTSLSRQIIS